jgi:hypothetical protein
VIQIPFRAGDVCEYIGNDEFWRGTHIIHELSLSNASDWEYSTTQGAWIGHEELKLVRNADQKSLRQLVKSLGEE